jgi:integrase
MLNEAVIRRAQARPAAYKMFDQGGLHLFVARNGRKSFRMRFRMGGREQLLTFGVWPEVSLNIARDRCTAANDQLKRGIDPRAGICEIAQSSKFEDVGRRWHAHMVRRWTPVHARDVIVSLERDVFPAIGAMAIDAITTPVVLTVLRAIEARGRYETVRRVRQRISAIFAFAMAEDLVQSDPAAIVGRALMPPAPRRHHPAIVDLDEARALVAATALADGAPAIKLAARFLALTAVRLAAVRGARWDEIADLDGAAPVWRVPAARMKLPAAKKTDSAHDHLVPLSPAAVAVVRAARALGTGAGLVFPGGKAGTPIGEAAIGALIARAGFGGRHVPHGWRATFSTLMNERFPEDRIAIDQALAHAAMGTVEAAYNRAVRMERRRWLFERWAEMLLDQAPA